ncbi:MAG: hypothetical protein N3G18_05685 [Candidatus Saccharicenans sp.]|nr:hypothetical protein [Candidatus Saccharicenans sp.]
MKIRKMAIFMVIVLALIFTLEAAAQAKKINNIGQYTFARVRGKIPTPEVMKMLVDRYSADIKTGFEQAGYGSLYEPFINQLKTAQFEDTVWNIGETVKWMLFRSHGKVKVSGELEWAGKKPVEVFAIKVKEGYKTYTFIIPKPCGNIAFKSMVEEIPEAICSLKVSPARANINDPITVDMSGTKFAKSMKVEIFDKQGAKVASKDLTPEGAKWQTKLDKPGEYVFKGSAVNLAGKPSANPCEGKVYINYPPVAKVAPSCTDCTNMYGKPLTFDASGSSDQDGEVTRVVFELQDAKGQVIDSYNDTEKPFTWEKTLFKEGTFTVSTTAYDNDGAVSTASEDSRKSFTVTRKKFFGLIEVGPMLAHGGDQYDLPSYVLYLYLRPGFFYWINPDKVSLTLTAGAGLPLKGDPWKAIIMGELLANFHFGKVYLGIGPGFTTKELSSLYNRKSGVDAVGQLGITLFDNYVRMSHLFFEFRAPIGRNFEDHHKMGLGFRYCF